MQVRRKNALPVFISGLKYNRTSTIAKNYGYIPAPCAEIKPERMLFRTYNKYVFIHACFNKLVGYTQCINKTAALIPDIQCTDLFHLHSPLEQYTATGEIVIGRKGCKNNKVNILCSNAGSFYRNLGSFHSHSSGGFFSPMCITALLDTGSFLDPFIT